MMEQVLTLYRISIDDIERTKQQQWKYFYYTIVSQGGLLYLYTDYFKEKIPISIFIFSVLTIILGGFCIYTIIMCQDDLKRFREKKNELLYYYFYPKLIMIERRGKQNKDANGEINYHGEIIIPKTLKISISIVSILYLVYYTIGIYDLYGHYIVHQIIVF